MEVLHALEERISQLIETIKKLKIEKENLVQENRELHKKIEGLELSVLHGKERMEHEISINEKEKALTKEVVDELIKNIDSLVGHVSNDEDLL